MRLKPVTLEDQATLRLDRVRGENRANVSKLPESILVRNVEEQLKNAVRLANRAILAYGEEQNDTRGLNCTVTLALVLDGQAYIANIGIAGPTCSAKVNWTL